MANEKIKQVRQAMSSREGISHCSAPPPRHLQAHTLGCLDFGVEIRCFSFFEKMLTWRSGLMAISHEKETLKRRYALFLAGTESKKTTSWENLMCDGFGIKEHNTVVLPYSPVKHGITIVLVGEFFAIS
jgi:hypothetical protein